jgi:hypothetical protein
MKEKKNIDRLFQEQLKDFEAMPDNHVWLNIEAELKKDKKRKIIPIWFKYSGIAAALLIGLFALNTILTSDSKTENGIVLDNENLKNSLNKKQVPLQKSSKKPQKEVQIVIHSNDKKEIIHSNNSKSIVTNEKKITPFNPSKTAVEKKKNQNDPGFSLSENHSAIKQSSTTEGQLASKNDIIISSESLSNQITDKKPVQDSEGLKKQPTIAAESPNELEEIFKNKSNQKDIVSTTAKNKWQITPNVAPVFLNASSGGSPIDSQLSENKKESDNSLSYGIGVHYAVNRKIVLRTGINKVVLGYNTNDVLYAAGLLSNNLTNISYTTKNPIEVKNASNYNALSSSEKNIQNTNTGALNQKMGYYELPLELSYAVLDKKFGINIIGGFSTLFLDENKISLQSSQSNIALGEAKNLNKVHLSTNFGLGFKYQLVKSFHLHFEPILKYQFNTFSRESNDFKPVFIGLYSGISYQF